MDACSFLSNIRHTLPLAQGISDEAELLVADMNRILDYFAKGSSDARREELLDKLYDRAWLLTDELYDIEASNKAASIDIPQALKDLEDNIHDDQCLGKAFEQIAQQTIMTRKDKESINHALLDESLPEYVRGALLSATLLHLVQWFDAELVEQLYIFTFEDQPMQIRMQAWVTLVLVAFAHEHRIAHLPRLKEQYKLICESEPQLLNEMQIALLQCLDAMKSDQRIHEIVDKFDEDKEESVQANMKEFIKMINEGTDLTINMFKKQAALPFFSAPMTRHHWLMPFSLEQPDMKKLLDAQPKAVAWVRMMMQSVAQCETEKYATVFTMNEVGKGLLMSAIGEKLEKTGLKFDEIMPVPPHYVMLNYVHDLYRYFSLHPEGKQMRQNLFDNTLLMCTNPYLVDAVQSPEQLDKQAELLFSREHWADAGAVYECMLKQNVSENILQRLAYCYYCDAANSGCMSTPALQFLQRCNLLYPGNKQTLKLLADLWHDSLHFLNEEIVLKEALQYFADDTNLLNRLGRCLNMQQRYKDALEPLYKADLIKEGRRNTQRELAIALFALHDYEHALQYAERLLSHSKLQSEDYCTCGFILLQQGKTDQALDCYLHTNKDDGMYSLLEHRSMLNEAGVDNVTIDLMYELIHRELLKAEE